MFTALTKRDEITAAYRMPAQTLTSGTRRFRRTVGSPNGNHDHTVAWHDKHRFWVIVSQHLTNRHWIAFGLQDPKNHKAMDITCEVNPPRSGMDRRCGGLFVRDDSGDVHLAHTGRIGGGRNGIGKRAFLASYQAHRHDIQWFDGNTSEAIVLGMISGKRFLSNVVHFIVEVDNFKRSAVANRDFVALIKQQAEIAETDGEFHPDNVEDARERTMAAIVRRLGQPRFRSKLLRMYENRCAISDCNCGVALEAAHIYPYKGVDNNHTTNGLLLRSDLHTLFDLRKIGITDDYRVVVSDELTGTAYARLHGKKLRLPADPAHWPNKHALQKHRAGMKNPSKGDH